MDFTGHALSLDQLPEKIWRDVDLAFDCLDKIPERLTLAKKCAVANVPLVHGAIAGWYGEVGTVWPGTGMLEKIYERRSIGVEKDVGNLPFTAATVASLMVAEAVRILLGKITKKEEKILFFDLLEGEWQTIIL